MADVAAPLAVLAGLLLLAGAVLLWVARPRAHLSATVAKCVS